MRQEIIIAFDATAVLTEISKFITQCDHTEIDQTIWCVFITCISYVFLILNGKFHHLITPYQHMNIWPWMVFDVSNNLKHIITLWSNIWVKEIPGSFCLLQGMILHVYFFGISKTVSMRNTCYHNVMHLFQETRFSEVVWYITGKYIVQHNLYSSHYWIKLLMQGNSILMAGFYNQ